MLTQEQKNQVAYNDNAVKNYERNKIIKSIYEKKEREGIKIRRQEQAKHKYIYNFIILHDRTEVNKNDLTEEQIDKEIEWGFCNN